LYNENIDRIAQLRKRASDLAGQLPDTRQYDIAFLKIEQTFVIVGGIMARLNDLHKATVPASDRYLEPQRESLPCEVFRNALRTKEEALDLVEGVIRTLGG
jgi:hypothetical protein